VIIAIEGLDGAGKTSVAHRVADALAARYVAVPPEDLKLSNERFLSRHDSVSRYLYYLAAVAEVQSLSFEGGLIVADRFVASAHALHVHVVGDVADHLRRLPISPPEMTVYLDVNEESRRERLRRRGRSLDAFERRLEVDGRLRGLVANAMRTLVPTQVIDTSVMPVEEVTLWVVRAWHARSASAVDLGRPHAQ
jgi:thymidylate kinase